MVKKTSTSPFLCLVLILCLSNSLYSIIQVTTDNTTIHLSNAQTFTPPTTADQRQANVSENLTCSSDRRLKKEVRDYEKALETIALLSGKEYYWKAEKFVDKPVDKRLKFGFIAQEVETVLPNLVYKDQYGYKSVDYIQIIPILTNAIQSLQTENQQLYYLLQELEKKINTLER